MSNQRPANHRDKKRKEKKNKKIEIQVVAVGSLETKGFGKRKEISRKQEGKNIYTYTEGKKKEKNR